MSWIDAVSVMFAIIFAILIVGCVVGAFVALIITYGWVAVAWIVGVLLFLVGGTALIKWIGSR